MSFDPYLHFQGRCREAFEFYRQVFGGTLEMMPYSANPDWPADAPEALRRSDHILHACLTLPDGRMLMGSDFPETMEGERQQAVSILHVAPDLPRAQEVFFRLEGRGGEVISAFQPTFFSTGFGMVKDRFGTQWMVSGPTP